MNRPTAALVLAAALMLVPADPGRAQEKASDPDATTLRIRPKADETLRFRRTLTLAGESRMDDSRLPLPDYEVVQDLDVTLKSSESGRHRFSVHCATVNVKATQTGDDGPVSGVWSSDKPEPDFEKDGDFMCVASASMMGSVLAGTTLGLVTDERATSITVEDTAARRAAEKEAGPSSSFQPALLEGVAWGPLFLDPDLPEDPVRAGSTFERDVAWPTKLPGVVVRASVQMKVLEANAKQVVMECAGVPRLHKRGRPGKAGETLPETVFTDASVTGRVTLSATDGLPLEMTWTVKGTYHLANPGGMDGTLHQQAKLTVRVERIPRKSK